MAKFYARTDPENPHQLPEEGAYWQELKDHLEGTEMLACHFSWQSRRCCRIDFGL